MKYKRIVAALFLFGCLAAMTAFTTTDDDPIAKIIASLEKWTATYPQEKVYLQLDRPYYSAGDDIWFKAYVTAGGDHKLSNISGVLNVELINDRDSVKLSEELPIVAGLTWGDFALPDTMKEGSYRVRAYTNWMRNAGEDYFFDERISIVNAVNNDVFTKAHYTYDNGKQKVNAIINYADVDGEPYAGKQVSYEVKSGVGTIARGRGETDDKGNLDISFSDAAGLKRGRIVTSIRIDKTTVTKSVPINAASDKADVQFFPEGGNLVYGNESKVAFKAIGPDGWGASIKGMVLDDEGKQAAVFNTSHAGMGVFNFTPQNGKTYKARVTFPDGSENTLPLPAATNSGYTLNIDNSDPAQISINIKPGSIVTDASAVEGISLVGQSGGVVYYAGKSKPCMKSFTALVPKNKFPTGIAQFTLFSASGEPINERLVFIQKNDQLKLNVISDRQTYQPRQKVKIDLDAEDAAGKPVVGSFSVSVTDETKVPGDETTENGILSNLLLTSDLRGYIENPGYYFTDPNGQTAADLDALMLTQGYHRFEWKQVLSDNFPPVKFQSEKTLEISGHLKNLLGKPVANGRVMLFTNKGGAFMVDTVSDKNGNFTFKNLVFKDSVTFVVQARTSKDHKNVEIDVDRVSQSKTAPGEDTPPLQVNISNDLSGFLKNSKEWYANQLKYGLKTNSIVLGEVKINAKKINPAENSSNLNGPGNADQVVSGADIATGGCARPADCLQGRLTGVRFMNGVPYLIGGLKYPMEIVVDGLTVDTIIFNNLSASDIASIEVLKNIEYTAVYGGRGANGVLIVTMKRGGADYSVQRYAPGVITYSPKGYYKVRTFYSPQYDDPKTNAEMPDLRPTVFWKPDIVTRDDGRAAFEYFNTDNKGTYKVTIEGIDSKGNLGRRVYRYKVE